MAATTARKTTTRKPKPAGTSGVLALDRKENIDRFAEREPLFSIGGVEYTIPKDIPASLSMRVLDEANKTGGGQATDLALMEVLGEDGWNALKNCETLTAEDLGTVVDIIMKKVLPASVYGPKASTEEPTSE